KTVRYLCQPIDNPFGGNNATRSLDNSNRVEPCFYRDRARKRGHRRAGVTYGQVTDGRVLPAQPTAGHKNACRCFLDVRTEPNQQTTLWTAIVQALFDEPMLFVPIADRDCFPANRFPRMVDIPSLGPVQSKCANPGSHAWHTLRGGISCRRKLAQCRKTR